MPCRIVAAMQRRRTFALIPCLTAAIALAEPADTRLTRFEPLDLFALELALDPQISPGGRTVAYVRESNDIMTDRARRSIWLVDCRDGTHSPLPGGEGSSSQPRWSPDGSRLAYISTADETPQLHVYWLQQRAATPIARLPDAPNALSWSPDGRSIAYSMFVPEPSQTLGAHLEKPERAQWAPPAEVITEATYRSDGAGILKPGHHQIFSVPADGGTPRQLTRGAFNHEGPLSWTPDGGYIVLSANRSENGPREPLETEIYQLAVADGRITRLTERKGPDHQPAVSPDGRWIAYLGFDDQMLSYRNRQLYLTDRSGNDAHSLTARLDRSIDAFQWGADSRRLYIQYADRGHTKLATLALGGELRDIGSGLSGSDIDRPYSGGQFSVAHDGTVAFTSGTAERPSDISVLQQGRARRLTALNENLLQGKALGRVLPLAVRSSDSRSVDAWLVTPPEFDPAKKYPLILEIHGGPFASYGPVFSTDVQLYAAADYVVLYANPSGSTSYGEEFANLIHRAYPGPDYDDLMSAVDAAVATGFVDADNLFVTGGSGGGLLTAWTVGRTKRFRASAAQKPVINWTSMVLTSDTYLYTARYWFEKLPWESPEVHWSRSPLSLVGNVSTPTLMIVGSEDIRSPVGEAEQYYQALQLRGVSTALIRIPGASHGGLTARPSQSAARINAILAWFARYRAQ